MSTDTRVQLAELRRMSMSDLKDRWRDLIGTDPPQYSRSLLVSRLAYRLQELAYGGLSPSALADMDAILDDAGCDKLGAFACDAGCGLQPRQRGPFPASVGHYIRVKS